jgi:hypothetical protein
LPKVVEVGLNFTAVVLMARATVKDVVPLDGALLVLPEYVPVTMSVPTGAIVALQLAEPEDNAGVVHNVLAPSLKVTEPVGVPEPEVTVAV